jgi:hypothetical protein
MLSSMMKFHLIPFSPFHPKQESPFCPAFSCRVQHISHLIAISLIRLTITLQHHIACSPVTLLQYTITMPQQLHHSPTLSHHVSIVPSHTTNRKGGYSTTRYFGETISMYFYRIILWWLNLWVVKVINLLLGLTYKLNFITGSYV